MKRLIAVLLCLLILAGCTAGTTEDSGAVLEESTEETTIAPVPETTQLPTEPATEATTEPTTEPTTVPTEPSPTAPEIFPNRIGIYIPAEDGSKARVRLSEFVAKRTAKEDIDCFEILATQVDRTESGAFRNIWSNAWNEEPTDPNAKIGFHISFTLASGETVSATILKPSDPKFFYDYLEIYLYDDIHQTPGVWYTHLEDQDMKAETVISSIKLTSGSKIKEVGDITLTAFIYTGEDCFDKDGNYIGNISETITIRIPE